MGRNNQKISKAKKQGYAFTLNQLKIWNVKFHKLIFGKPSYDLIIDDKGLGFKKNWYVNFIQMKYFFINNKNRSNFWINSKAYNHIELANFFFLLNTGYFIIGRPEYKKLT